ncbi:MAG: glutamate--tRNA ligase, partial [Methanimicrococcus sp.]|nr:glutamate--tRNA ligase [Methanimicrococcus sp.]
MSLDPKDLNTIEKYTLQNAVKYEAVPQEKAVLGKIMGVCPHLRANVSDVTAAIREITTRLGKEPPEDWARRLDEIAPELAAEITA